MDLSPLNSQLISRIDSILIDKTIDYKNNRGKIVGGIFIPLEICSNYDDVKKLLDGKIAKEVATIEKHHDTINEIISTMPKSITSYRALKWVFKASKGEIYNLFVRYYVAVNNLQLLIFNRDNTIEYDIIEY